MVTNALEIPESPILVEKFGRVARISHNRPRARNAENTALLDAMDLALQQANADPDVGAIIIAGVGDHFCAGHDLKEALAERKDYGVEARWEYEERRYFQYALNIWDSPKPTIAQVQGACVGAGFMVANLCDLVIASEDAYFADPVVQSIASASVEVLIHPYVMGLRKAKEFLLTGEKITAEEGHRIGMINQVTTRGELEARTLAMATRIANAPAFAVRLTKRSLNRSAEAAGLRTVLSAHFETHQLTHVTDETRAIREGGSASLIARGAASVATAG